MDGSAPLTPEEVPPVEAPQTSDGGSGVVSAQPSETAVRIEPHFANVRASPTGDMSILDHVIRLIDDTPAGAQVRVAIHSLTVNLVQDALIRAHKRGVEVFVAHNGADQNSTDASPAQLRAAIGANHHWCGHGGTAYGCISTDTSGIMHSKLMLISKTKDSTGAPRSYVTWFGSANLTYATGANSFNNTLTVYDDRVLYDSFVSRYFTLLYERTTSPNDDFYDMGRRGFFESSASHIQVHASPAKNTDIVLNVLASVKAEAGCEIRAAQAFINDSRIVLVRKLIELKNLGCQVSLVVGDVQPSSLAALKAAGIAVRTDKIHDKYVMTYSHFAGSTERKKIVFTGSHNWSYSANYENDELFVKVDDAAVYQAFISHFASSYDLALPL
jgi:phosphatidylserine/phosphatidylglycerophosphate/cardiolipin synthase-like enzyme